MAAETLAALAPIIAAGIGSGASITSSVLATKKQREWAAEQSQIQRDWTRQMWDAENAYNTPSAQVQRLIDAGLNPNLAYGQLDMSPITAGSGAEASSSAMPDFSSFSSLGLQLAQIKNINADTAQKEKSLELTDAQVKDVLADYAKTTEEVEQVKLLNKNLQTENEKLNMEILNLQANTEFIRANKYSKQNENFVYERLIPTTIKHAQAQFDIDSQKAKLMTECILADIGVKQSQRYLNYHQAELAAAQASTEAYKQQDYKWSAVDKYFVGINYILEAKNLTTQNAMLSFEKQMLDKYGEKMTISQLENSIRSANQLRQQTFSGYINTLNGVVGTMTQTNANSFESFMGHAGSVKKLGF